MQVPLKCLSATAYVLHTGGSSELFMDLSSVNQKSDYLLTDNH